MYSFLFPTCDVILYPANLILRLARDKEKLSCPCASFHGGETLKIKVLCCGLRHPPQCCRTRNSLWLLPCSGQTSSRPRSQGGLLHDIGGAARLVDKAVFSHPLFVSDVLQHSIPQLLWKQVGDHRDILGNTKRGGESGQGQVEQRWDSPLQTSPGGSRGITAGITNSGMATQDSKSHLVVASPAKPLLA